MLLPAAILSLPVWNSRWNCWTNLDLPFRFDGVDVGDDEGELVLVVPTTGNPNGNGFGCCTGTTRCSFLGNVDLELGDLCIDNWEEGDEERDRKGSVDVFGTLLDIVEIFVEFIGEGDLLFADKQGTVSLSVVVSLVANVVAFLEKNFLKDGGDGDEGDFRSS